MGRMKRDAIDREERRRSRASAPTTLGDIAARGLAVFCWCNRCGHNAELPSERLAAELGPALPVPEVGARLRCSGCQSKDVATRPAWPSLGQVARHHDSAEASDAREGPDAGVRDGDGNGDAGAEGSPPRSRGSVSGTG